MCRVRKSGPAGADPAAITGEPIALERQLPTQLIQASHPEQPHQRIQRYPQVPNVLLGPVHGVLVGADTTASLMT